MASKANIGPTRHAKPTSLVAASKRVFGESNPANRLLFPPFRVRYYSENAAEGIKSPQESIQSTKEVAKDYIPQTGKTLETLRAEDQSMTVRKTTQPLDTEDPEYLASRYKGFVPSETAPNDLSAYRDLEEVANIHLKNAATSRNVHQMREEAQAARDKFEELLAASGNHGASPNVLFHLGLACEMLKDWSCTVEAMTAALQMDAGLVPAKRHLAEALQALQRHPEAIHYFDEFYNDFPRYYGRLADSQNQMTTETGEKIDMDGDGMLADVVFSRGRSYFAMGHYGLPSAKEDFKSVYRLNGKQKASALYFLGQCEQIDKDYWKAIKYYDLALKTGPAKWFMYKGRADAWRALGKEDRADSDERAAHVLKRELHWEHQLGSSPADPLPEFSLDPYLDPSAIKLPKSKTM